MLKKTNNQYQKNAVFAPHFIFYFISNGEFLLNGNPLKLSDFCPRTISLGYGLDLKMTHDASAQRYGPPTITEH